MTNSDDPLYIVPAVVPDEEPVSSKRSVSRSATTQVVPVRTGDAASPPYPTVVPESSASRTIRFERPAVRRTTRTLRYIDPWSVFRVALVAHLVLYVVLLLAGVLLWNVANATGTVDNVERFMESFGWESFEFKGGELFHQA
ncbi:MAG: DUF3566 domain-containing protein, partial [Actinomycetota bacterium]